ncbi:hypothetical protein Tco_0697329 [Tanacetum coccineum]
MAIISQGITCGYPWPVIVDYCGLQQEGYFWRVSMAWLRGSIRGAYCGTEGDMIVDRLSDSLNRAGPAELGDSYGGYGERTTGVVKTLMYTKVGESELSDDFRRTRLFIDRVSGRLVNDHNNDNEDRLRLRWMSYLVVLVDAAEGVRDATGFGYCLASSSGWTKSPVLWAEIEGSSLIGPELVQETTNKVVVIKEKLQAARDRQKSYADSGRKMIEYEHRECIGLPFESKEDCPCAYSLRLPEELIGVHDTFHVLNLKKCLGNANLHVPLNEIKIDKTLRFVEEPLEIMDREVKRLKRSRIPLVKVRWNSNVVRVPTWNSKTI